MMWLVSAVARISASTLENGVRYFATVAPSVNKKKIRRYYKYRPKPKITQEERLELERETAEMRAVTRELAQDPEALEQLVFEGLPEEYDVVHDASKQKWDAKRDDERLRQLVKNKIIERKYYRPPREVNLLTWAAKEQIKHLNSEFPEEWTPEQIAKSFPISREGAIKLLRSNYVPRTAHNVHEHDKRVVENWKLLKEGGQTGGPLADRKLTMQRAGNMVERLNNFGGMPYLPKPVKEVETIASRRTTPGLFESLLIETDPKIETKTLSRGKLQIDDSENQRQISKIVAQFNEEKNHLSKRLGIMSYLRDQNDVDSSEALVDLSTNEPRFLPDNRNKRKVTLKRRSSIESNKNLLQ